MPNTSGAPIGDVIVAFCTQSVIKKSYQTAEPEVEQDFFMIQNLSWGVYPQTQYEG